MRSVRDNELDLHGLKVAEALNVFVGFYNARLSGANRSEFSVVHGYGSTGSGGKIRNRIRKMMDRFPDRVEYIPGERLTGNPGETIVKPIRHLPSQEEGLEAEILAYCTQGKSEGKIIGNFRRYGEADVKNSIKSLAGKQALREYIKGRYKYYISEVGGEE